MGTDERRSLVTSLWHLSGSGHLAGGGESGLLCGYHLARMSGASPRHPVSPGHLLYDLGCHPPALSQVTFSKDKQSRGVSETENL